MKKNVSTFFFVESNALDRANEEVQQYVISIGIIKNYQHRCYEWKNCHGGNIFEEAYTKLADILSGWGFDVDIDDNWLRVYTTDEAEAFKEVCQVIDENKEWLDEMFDI